MARLALSVVGGVLGAIFIPGVGASLGFALGSTIGGVVGALAFPGRGTHIYGPRVNDLQISSSAPGSVIPQLWGSMRYGGQIIAGSSLQEVANTTSQSAKGGPSVSQTTYTYFVTVAAAFCQGPATITRVWGDSKLIYDKTGGTSSSYQGTWDNTVAYNVGDIVQLSSTYYLCRVPNTNENPSSFFGSILFWSVTSAPPASTPGQLDKNIKIKPTLYTGSSTQTADPTLVALLGANKVPGYRGICYLVYEKLPLADFGNRLPNLRAEVTTVSTPATPEVRTPINFDGSNTYSPAYIKTSPDGLVAFVANLNGPTGKTPMVARIDLTTNTVVVQGELDSSTISPVTDLSGSAPLDGSYTLYGGSFIVDSNYDLWAAEADTNGQPLIVCYDGMTLKAKSYIPASQVRDAMYTPVGFPCTLYHANDGQEYFVTTTFYSTFSGWNAAGFTTAVFQLGNYHALVNGGSMENTVQGLRLAGQYTGFAVPQLNPTDTFQEPQIVQYQACLDQKGHFYQIFHGLHDDSHGSTYATYDWYIAKVYMPGGVSNFVAGGSPQYADGKNIPYTGNSTTGKGVAMMYCDDDNTLIVCTDTGAIHKIDADSMAILQTVGGTGSPQFKTSSPWWDVTITALACRNQKCATTNGVFYLPNPDGINGHITVFNANDLSVNSTIDLFAFPHMPSRGTIVTTGSDVLVFDENTNSLALIDYGWSVPDYPTTFSTKYAMYRMYLNRLSTSGYSCDQIVKKICNDAGIDDANLDVSSLASLSVKGYPVSQIQPGKDMINNLASMLFFEGREKDFKLQFIPRGQSSIATISLDDLGMESDKCHMTESLGPETERPKVVEVVYTDPDLDYQQGKQQRVRHSKTKKTKNVTSISTPIVMSSIQAQQIADKILWLSEAESRTYKTSAYKAYNMLYDPCDVLTLNTEDGYTLTARLTQNQIGQNFATAWELTSEDSNNYQSSAASVTDTGFVPQTLSGLSPTNLFLLDLPYLSDTDADATGNTGYYFCGEPSAPGGTWRGFAFYDSTDAATYTQEGSGVDSPSYGQISAALPAPRCPWSWDDVNTITVRMINGVAPTSTTDENVLNGANGAILATSGEVIQFGTVTTNTDGTITLSHLLRGRRGTEWACGTSVAGERIIFPQVQGGLHRNQVGQALIGQTRYWKAVTLGMDVNSKLPVLTYALQGNDLKPYAPELAAATVNTPSTNDWTIGWVRRTRLGWNWSGSGSGGATYNGLQVALSEDGQAYYIEITDSNGNVKRGSVVTSNRFVYTSAMQTTDFGSHQTTLYFNLYQLSAQVGQGFKSSWVIKDSTSLPAVDTAPAMANPTVSGSSGGVASGGFLINGA